MEGARWVEAAGYRRVIDAASSTHPSPFLFCFLHALLIFFSYLSWLFVFLDPGLVVTLALWVLTMAF